LPPREPEIEPEREGQDVDTIGRDLATTDLLISPDIDKLSEDQLANVYLSAEVPTIGKIEFAQPVDLRGWTRDDIQRVIQLKVGEVVVYPDADEKPPPGVGLNRAATITLYQCFPPTHQNQAVQTGDARARYERKIQRMTEQKGARFISYDPVEGEWAFAVDRF